jgi:hypothetical protein
MRSAAHRFDGDAQIEHVAHEFDIDLAHARAAIGLEQDQAFALQAVQRLADGHVAGRVTPGQRVDLQPPAERILARQDILTQPVADRARGDVLRHATSPISANLIKSA